MKKILNQDSNFINFEKISFINTYASLFANEIRFYVHFGNNIRIALVWGECTLRAKY